MVRDNNQGGSSRSMIITPFRSFLSRLYEIVDDPSTNSIISLSESGNSFIVWNQSELCNDVLPRYAQGSLLSNFTFKLDKYGFRKVESEQWEYAHDRFLRGKPELADEIWNRHLATRPPDTSAFKREAEAARIFAKTRALRLAIQERFLARDLSTLDL